MYFINIGDQMNYVKVFQHILLYTTNHNAAKIVMSFEVLAVSMAMTIFSLRKREK